MVLPSQFSVLLQSQLEAEGAWLQFDKPLELIVANSAAEVLPCFEEMQAKQAEGYYLAGYLAYEAAAGLNPAMYKALNMTESSRMRQQSPLLCFGVYKAPSTIDFHERYPPTQDLVPQGLDWRADISLENYAKSIEQIKQEIASGNTYQVNYSFRMHSKFEANPFELFLKLQRAQSANFGAYLNMGSQHICSASPELFFTLKRGRLSARPMKGTINRGLHTIQDHRRSAWLQNSEKNRAENLMIVDMIRNDLGRVADTGSVSVEKLFDIETYPTVYQMTSSISAQTGLNAFEVLSRMFPCASITGAPKINTMKIISSLESSARGIYTGSIGYVTPEGDAQFNVAIRSVLVDTDKALATYGVGGGIVWDSTIEDEYRECKIKAEILMREPPAIKLLEGFRLQANGEVYLLEEHLQRLQQTCEYFGFPYNDEKIRQLIDTTCRAYAGENHKLRLLVDAEGVPEMSAVFLGSRLHYRVAISKEKSNTQSRFVYHKTNFREFYDELIQKYDVDDVVIVNADGNITESCSANVVIVKDGVKLTPQIESGLLNGCLRKKLVQEGELQEAIISFEDFESADERYLINSVRGWMQLEATEEGLYSIVGELLPL